MKGNIIMKQLQKIIYILIPYAVVELLQFFIITVIAFVKGIVEIPDDILYIMSASISAVCGIVFFIWYRFEFTGEIKGSFHTFLKAKYIALLIALGTGCQFFFSGLMSLTKPFFERTFDEYSKILQQLTDANFAVVLIFMIIIAPVSEELIFRAVILRRAERLYGFIYANILQAILFGLYHGNLVQGIYAALIGLILGAVSCRFKTVYASIALHMIINASSLLMALIPDKLISYIAVTLLGAILMAAGMILILHREEQ